jgi:hypothetical protein
MNILRLANDNEDPGNIVRRGCICWKIPGTSHLAFEVQNGCGENAVEMMCEMLNIVFPKGTTDMKIAQQACRVLLAVLDERYGACTFDELVFKDGKCLQIEAQAQILCNAPFRRFVRDLSGNSVSVGSTENIADDTVLQGMDAPNFLDCCP